MPFYIVTLQLPNGKKTQTQNVFARNEWDARYRAEQIGKWRHYTAIKAEEVKS